LTAQKLTRALAYSAASAQAEQLQLVPRRLVGSRLCSCEKARVAATD